jgi:carboxyl-terminal processing protease
VNGSRNLTSWLLLPASALVIFGIALFVTARERSQASMDAMEKLAWIAEVTQSEYYQEVDLDRLYDSAYRGVLAELDPWSVYYTKAEFDELKSDTSGKFIGVGIEITMEKGYLEVISPIQGAPAEAAGVLPGDIVTHVNQQDISEWTLEKIVQHIRGEPGTSVTLTVQHRDSNTPEDIEITRAVIKILPVKDTHLVTPEIGYLRITRFNENTVSEFDNAYRDLREQGIKALIVDLRFNPGGLLNQAVTLADRFVSEGLITRTAGRKADSEQEYPATAEDDLPTVPMVILQNENSASASEILAAAWNDHGLAEIVGEPSFGKGLVQRFFPLPDGSGVKLTIARYYTPNGIQIHKVPGIKEYGIKPDHEVPMDDEQERHLWNYWRLKHMTENGLEPPESLEVPDDFTDPQMQKAIERLEEKLGS